MKKLLTWSQKAEDFILVATFVIMVLASFAQVVNRNIVHASISWFDELARYCMVYMALLAAEAGLRDGTQISITAVTDKLQGMTKKVVAIISKLVVIGFSSVAFVSSFVILEKQILSNQMSPGLKIPMYVPYFALPLTFGIITVVQLSALILLIMSKPAPAEVEKEGNNS